ncbi:MAG TPA: DNA-directed RNA polymerase subunit beta', partial [Verrucomicrobiota bacterium]|nr:DNA-directed RNA polymerase subunit beta' [Verrucomicrobiota bacterium]
REGLTVAEYFISTHGARKGLADTALKTADSGYMTRKLVDVSQDVIIREEDCGTTNGIWIEAIVESEEEVVKLSDRIIGRFAADDVVNPSNSKEFIVKANEEITEEVTKKLEKSEIAKIKVRSVLTCESRNGVCAKCYGRNLATGKMVDFGEAVGIIAAQSIGEPGTQLTMRTFHIGGTASQTYRTPQIISKNSGIVRYNDIRCVELEDGNFVVLNKNGSVSIIGENEEELETHQVTTGTVLFVKDGEKFRGYTIDEKTKEKVEGQLIAAWDPYSVPIISEKAGKVKFIDIIEQATVKYEVDPVSGKEAMVIIEHKEDLHPRIAIVDENEEEIESYAIPAGAYLMVNDGDYLSAGTIIAKTPRQTLKTKDITGGLPRVAELFEARRPKDAAEISKIDGRVEFGPIIRDKRKIIIRDERTGISEEHELPVSKHVIPFNGDYIRKGQQLCEGPIDPHEILEVCGPQELQEYLVNEVQEVYRLQGVTINDKHIEIIVRQMLRKVRIVEPGDTQFLWGEQVDKIDFEVENQRVVKMGGKPAEAQPVLLGITKASLETDSFLSAASFQDTTRILTEAATLSKVDHLKGFKENVIIGHIIPAGTGFVKHRKIYVKPLVETGFQQEEQQEAISATGS